MVIDNSFWKGRKVFVTGHTGFKGGWLSIWLQSMGAEVTGYSLAAPTTPSFFETASVDRDMVSHIGDIRDLEQLSKALTESRAEVVFHLAAQPLVRYSYDAPVETYATNVLGTVHVLEAIRQTPSVRAGIMITSDKCYENREWVWGYRENEAMGGYDPYSSSKGCAELVTSAYRSSYFNPDLNLARIASARAGNVIGGGDWALDRLVPDLLRAFEGGQAAVIRKPDAIRPWQHVLEPLSGYLTLAHALITNSTNLSEGWNFGPADEDAKPVHWITEKMARVWGNGAQFQIDRAAETVHEANYLKLDCSKAHAKLNWQPRWSLETALVKVVEWHKHYLNKQDMRAFTIEQIADYSASNGTR